LIERDGGYYPIQDPETGWWYPCNPNSVWRYASEQNVKGNQKLRTETIESFIADNRIVFSASKAVTYHTKQELLDAIEQSTGPKDGKGRPLLRPDLPDLDFWIGKPIGLGRPSKKLFWEEKDKKIKPAGSYIFGGKEQSPDEFWRLETGKQGDASGEILEIFGSAVFDNPKPVSLIRSLVEASVGPDSIVLDFFAGSSTTAQAVMELNAEDGGDRRFIMVSSTEATGEEPDKNICRDVTAERVRRLNANADEYDELSAGFAYLRCREINPLEMDDALTSETAWSILEAHHGLPLTVWPAGESFALHEGEEVTLALIDYWNEAAAKALSRVFDSGRPVFLYAFATGQIAGIEPSANVEVRSIRETLQRLFAA
ncbi:MAG: DNA methyltransferase, partial [Pseudomonadota bacterium]